MQLSLQASRYSENNISHASFGGTWPQQAIQKRVKSPVFFFSSRRRWPHAVFLGVYHKLVFKRLCHSAFAPLISLFTSAWYVRHIWTCYSGWFHTCGSRTVVNNKVVCLCTFVQIGFTQKWILQGLFIDLFVGRRVDGLLVALLL